MARLPIPGGDEGIWGTVLNEFLEVSHNENGTLKSNGFLLVAASDAPAEIKNVATYVCDGEEDEEEINEALTEGAGSGQAVVLSVGSFTAESSIVIPANNSTLIGQGSSKTTITYSGSNGSDLIAINDYDNVIIRGLGLAETSGNGCGIHATDCDNLKLEDILSTGMTANHGATESFPWSWGQIYLDGCSRAHLKDVSATSSGTARGIFLQDSNDTTIEGGLTEFNNYEGHYIDNCERTILLNIRSGNNGTNVGGPVPSFATNVAFLIAPYTQIIGGEIYGFEGSSKDAAGDYGENNLDLYICDHATVIGTRIHNAKDNGVYVHQSSYVRLIGIEVYQSRQQGVTIADREEGHVTSNAATLIGVDSHHNHDNGLRVTTANAGGGASISDVNAIGCYFTNNDEIGLLAEDGSHNIYLENCDLTENGGGNNGWWWAFGTGINAVAFRSCNGPVTFAQGTGSITDSNTSVTLAHGINFAPHIEGGIGPTAADFSLTLTNAPDTDPGPVWISDINPTEFTVNCATNPGESGLSFAFTVRTREHPAS